MLSAQREVQGVLEAAAISERQLADLGTRLLETARAVEKAVGQATEAEDAILEEQQETENGLRSQRQRTVDWIRRLLALDSTTLSLGTSITEFDSVDNRGPNGEVGFRFVYRSYGLIQQLRVLSHRVRGNPRAGRT